jgi:hypothetical protein
MESAQNASPSSPLSPMGTDMVEGNCLQARI